MVVGMGIPGGVMKDGEENCCELTCIIISHCCSKNNDMNASLWL